MDIIKSTKKYSIIYNDINNTCNARCKYCINDWETETEHIYMTREKIEKIIEVLPWLEGSFLFGCLYEPSVHSKYLDLVNALIPQYKAITSYTTNLVRNITDEEIEALAQSNIGKINFSIDTLDASVSSTLMGIKKNNILENLRRIKSIFSKSINPPKIAIITMILRDNYNELLDLALFIKEEINPEGHEFRTPYYDINMGQKRAYIESQLLSREELTFLENGFKSISDKIICNSDVDRETYLYCYEQEKQNKNRKAVLVQLPKEEFYTIRINSNGDCLFYGDGVVINIDDMKSPFLTFGERLMELQSYHAKSMVLSQPPTIIKQLNYKSVTFIDRLIEYDDTFIALSGWVSVKEFCMGEYKKYVVVENEGEESIYKANTIKRVDVAKELNLPQAEYSGFETLIKTKKEWFDKNLRFYILLEDSSGNFYKTEKIENGVLS